MQRKTNRYYQKNKAIKSLILFIVVQVLIFTLFAVGFVQRKQVQYEETDKVSFKADSYTVNRNLPISTFRKRVICIYNGSIKYRVDIVGFDEQLKELEEILPSEKITVVYEKKTNNVVEISSSNKTYFTLGDYNREQHRQRVACILLFPILELIYLCVLRFHLLSIDFKRLFK